MPRIQSLMIGLAERSCQLTRMIPVNSKTGTHVMWIATFTYIIHQYMPPSPVKARALRAPYRVVVVSSILRKLAIVPGSRETRRLTKISCFSRLSAMLK